MFFGVFFKVCFFLKVFFVQSFFFQEGSFSQRSVFSKHVFSKFIFQWGPFFLFFFFTGAWVLFFEKVLFFFYRRGLNFCKGFFFKKENFAFSARSECFPQRGQVFSFLKRCGFLLFFKWFCFVVFAKHKDVFFFSMVEFFLKKKSFLQCFGREGNVFFFFKKKKVVVFSPRCLIFFKIFAFLKIKSFSLFLLGGCT